MELLMLVVGWILAGFIGITGALVLWAMFRGHIKLDKLISEPEGDASLSRFQFLIFTFVIAMSVFVITVSKSPPQFPEIPTSVLALLGISAGSYVVAKGIQTSRDTRSKEIELAAEQRKTEVTLTTTTPNGPAVQPVPPSGVTPTG
jgi:hypothetical protein